MTFNVIICLIIGIQNISQIKCKQSRKNLLSEWKFTLLIMELINGARAKLRFSHSLRQSRQNTKHSSNRNFKLKLIGILFSQRWPTTIGFSNRCIFGIFKHLCIELRPSEWSIKWGYSGSECNRSQLAWFGYIFNEKIPWRCHWTITCAIPSTIFTIFFGSLIG